MSERLPEREMKRLRQDYKVSRGRKPRNDGEEMMQHIGSLESELTSLRTAVEAADTLAQTFEKLQEADSEVKDRHDSSPYLTVDEWMDTMHACESYRAARAVVGEEGE